MIASTSTAVHIIYIMKLHSLPFEILDHLFGFVEIEDYLALRLVNRKLQACVKKTFGQHLTSWLTSKIRSEDFAKLRRFVEGRHSIGTLNMSGAYGIFALLTVEKYHSWTENLTRFAYLWPRLTSNPTITNLDLSYNNLNNDDILDIFKMLKQKYYTIHLSHLNLSHNNITDFSCIQAIKDYFGNCIVSCFDNCIIDFSCNPLHNNQFQGSISSVRHVTLQQLPTLMPKFTFTAHERQDSTGDSVNSNHRRVASCDLMTLIQDEMTQSKPIGHLGSFEFIRQRRGKPKLSKYHSTRKPQRHAKTYR